MSQEYCGSHSIHYAGDSCPRCDAEERHRELLRATEESAAETIDAMRESDYRRANPGDYACPHCKYISLRNDASRCTLCHGEVGAEYWSSVRARERAAEERRRAEVEARIAEEKRTAPARAAAAKAAAERAAEEAQGRRIAIVATTAMIAILVIIAVLVRRAEHLRERRQLLAKREILRASIESFLAPDKLLTGYHKPYLYGDRYRYTMILPSSRPRWWERGEYALQFEVQAKFRWDGEAEDKSCSGRGTPADDILLVGRIFLRSRKSHDPFAARLHLAVRANHDNQFAICVPDNPSTWDGAAFTEDASEKHSSDSPDHLLGYGSPLGTHRRSKRTKWGLW